MSDAPDNLVMTLLRGIRADVTAIEVESEAGLLEIKGSGRVSWKRKTLRFHAVSIALGRVWIA